MDLLIFGIQEFGRQVLRMKKRTCFNLEKISLKILTIKAGILSRFGSSSICGSDSKSRQFTISFVN